ncbi:hypothetical protein K6U39_23145, partial [Vibrio parahaemolyticus]|nr:hypothetical protein [Vibrio parahaemolyticus]
MRYKKISSLPILVVALLITGTTTTFSLSTTNSEKTNVYLANTVSTVTKKVSDIQSSKGLVYNE